MRVNEYRVAEVSRALSTIGLHGVLCLEERDPQYHAVRRVAARHGVGAASVLAALNALASYRLAMRGEDWWRCWAEHMELANVGSIEDAARAVMAFLDACRGAVLAREAKKRRVLRAARQGRAVLERLWSNPLSVLESGSWIVEGLARALSASTRSKTVVFAAKMAYYAARTVAGRRAAPWDVEIPVDARVSCFLYSTGMLEAAGPGEVMRRPRPAQEVVRSLARASGIPPLHLDTVFWRTGWVPRDLGPAERCRAVEEVLGDCAPRAAARALCRAFRKACK